MELGEAPELTQTPAARVCDAPAQPDEHSVLDGFAEIRTACPAVNRVLVPDSVWPPFRERCACADNGASHQSELLGAYLGGRLRRIASPIHRYLLTHGALRATKQYEQDLRETWLLQTQPVERHRRWRVFHGRVAELQFAEWLEERSWRITGLEALTTGAPDVQAVSHNGIATAFEVKFVGTQDVEFEMQIKSAAEMPSWHFVSVYGAINYLVFRVYEAAKQLRKASAACRTAVLVLDEMAWKDFELQLRKGWINWTRPLFVGGDSAWQAFMARQREDHPRFPDDLGDKIRSIDFVWIIRQSSGLDLFLKYDMPTRESNR